MRELLVEKSTIKSVIKRENCRFKHNVKLSTLIGSYRSFPVSFELCPSRNIDNDLLQLLRPGFLSVTWMVHDRYNINEIPAILLAESLQGYPVLLHLPGRNLDKPTALLILERLRCVGLRNLLILQGNRPFNSNEAPQVFPYASSLVRFVREYYQDYFYIAVAGYPDKHPESVDIQQDFTHLKEKVSTGADLIVTQACFDYESIETFANNCRNYSINTSILVGVFIINTYQSLMKMVEFCDLHIPTRIMRVLNSNRYNEEAIREYGIDLAVELIKQSLNNRKFVGVHIFTLNNMELVKCVLKRLGMIEWWIERPLVQKINNTRDYNKIIV